MIFQSLKLTKFRNHKSVNLSFIDGVNLIVGSNGSGKTNVLEAINLLSTGKSFRAHYDQEMIYNPHINDTENGVSDVFNSDLTQREFSRVLGTISNNKNEEILEIIIVKGNPYTNLSQKTFKVNGTPKPIYETAKYFPAVLFCPQDLDLFNGSPSLRRRFLDDLLYKVDQKYKKEHTIYTKAIRQRNRILEKINKTGRGDDELTFWTEEILKTGTYLQEKRAELIQILDNNIGQVYSDISSRATKVHIEYKINQINLERLKKHREHEIYAKTTLVGPHRDDFDFLINNFSISHYGSRGQQRTGVLALKICELGLVNQRNSTSPVLLLDDIFSELDDTHKKSLEEVVQKQQTIITSTHSGIKTQSTITL
ncbi:MAG: DNA replication and repair protein RecF [Patescibacteria group bacterium]